MTSLRYVVIVLGWLVLLSGTPVGAMSDEETVRQVLQQTVQAVANFPTTRDPQSVLSLYSSDYSGIQDGEAETREAVRQWLEEYGKLLTQGSAIRYAGQIDEMKVRLSGGMAWATYRYVFHVVDAGQMQGEDKGLCTAILQKELKSWVIQHEHCSQRRRSSAGG